MYGWVAQMDGQNPWDIHGQKWWIYRGYIWLILMEHGWLISWKSDLEMDESIWGTPHDLENLQLEMVGSDFFTKPRTLQKK